jgi:hypothetical protein
MNDNPVLTGSKVGWTELNNNNNNNSNNKLILILTKIKVKQVDLWQYQYLDSVLELLTGAKKNCKL